MDGDVVLEDVGDALSEGEFLDGVEADADDGHVDVGDGAGAGAGVEGGIGALEDAGGEGRVGFDGVLEIERAGVRGGGDFDDAVQDAAERGKAGVFHAANQFGEFGIHARAGLMEDILPGKAGDGQGPFGSGRGLPGAESWPSMPQAAWTSAPPL